MPTPQPLRYTSRIQHCLLAVILFAGISNAAETDLGDFDSQADIGTVQPPGTATFDKATREYHISSAGENIWAKHDDFHFVYRKITGDITLSGDVALSKDGKNAHRKGGLMIRQGLEPDDAYVDVMVHGDGLIALQFRKEKGGVTADARSTIKAPATVRIDRHGDVFTVSVSTNAPRPDAADKPSPESIPPVTVAFTGSVYVGLAVSSHDAKTSETAVFTDVAVKTGR